MLHPQATILDSVLQKLRDEVRVEQFETWFRGFNLVQIKDGEILFSAPSGFVRDWLSRNYFDKIQEAVDVACKEVGEPPLKIRITLDTSISVMAAASDQSVQNVVPDVFEDLGSGTRDTSGGDVQTPEGHAANLPSVGLSAVSSRLLAETPLNRGYTFEQFVVGPSNQLSHAASLAVGQNPGRAYNPLFIHGNVGMGKTHLLQSICHSIKKRSQPSRVVYLSCEEFTNRFILAIQSGKLDLFREHYRTADVLVIDDVQFLAGKDKTQEEFFHTFNSLYNTQKQIVISSDRPPVDIPTVEDRLVSRFKWGLVTDVQAPCYETRFAIIKRKALLRSVDLDDDVANLIAERVTTNIREVEGSVIKVIGVAAITERPITLALAEEALQGIGAPQVNQISIPDVISMITGEFSITARDLTGKSRTQKISLPRQIGMFLCREYTDHSLEEVGRFFGNRDHTTVLYAVTKIKKRAQTDKMFKELLSRLSGRLESGTFKHS